MEYTILAFYLGTEDERKEFMEVCVKTLDNYSKHDMVTPIFIFERLCNIIKPETEDVGHFCLSLDKDPQQEEFLQGRMQVCVSLLCRHLYYNVLCCVILG